MWVQIKVTLFNALVAAMLALGLRTGRNFFRFVFGKTFHYTTEGWNKLTRNVAWFFLGTAIINEAVRLGFEHAHFYALNRMFTGIDIWILFKLFIMMPVTALFMLVADAPPPALPAAETAAGPACRRRTSKPARCAAHVRLRMLEQGLRASCSRTLRRPTASSSSRLGIDLAPLLVFFAVYMTLGIYWATGALMVATVVSMIASWVLVGHISATLIVTTALVVGFGALTLSFNDPRFIKMKPTIVNLLFAGFLFGGLLLKRPVLQYSSARHYGSLTSAGANCRFDGRFSSSPWQGSTRSFGGTFPRRPGPVSRSSASCRSPSASPCRNSD